SPASTSDPTASLMSSARARQAARSSESADELALRRQLSRVQRQLADAQRDLADQADELAAEVEKRAAARAHATGIEQRLQASTAPADELAHQLEVQRGQLDAATSRADELQAQLDDLRATHETELAELRRAIATLRDERERGGDHSVDP